MMKNNNNPSQKIKNSLENNIFSKLFRNIGRFVDVLFSKNIILVIVSMIASAALYLYVIGIPNQLDLNNFDTKTLESVPVSVINDDNAKVVDVYDADGKLMDQSNILVDVIVKGPRNEVLKIINNKDEYKFFIDTTDVKDGETRDVSVIADNIPNDVTITSSPASFRIEANKRDVRDDLLLTVEEANKTKLGKNITIESITLNTYEVHIGGSSARINQVAVVKAFVDVAGITTVGETILDETKVSYKAYNSKGNVVDVKIDVKDKGAKVVTSNYSRDIEVKYIFDGEAPEGKSVGKYESDVEFVSIYGKKEDIDKVEFVEARVNLNDLNSGNTKVVNLSKPDGVASMSVEQAKIKVTYEDTSSRVISGVSVQQVNLESGYNVQSNVEGALLIDVEVIGAKSVIDTISAEDIILEVDLAGYSEGEHTVPVSISNQNSIVKYKLSKENVVLKIFKQ